MNLTQTMADVLRTRWTMGVGLRLICEELNSNPKEVRAWLAQLGLTTANRPGWFYVRNVADHTKLDELIRKQTMTDVEIAEVAGYSLTTVSDRRHYLGLPSVYKKRMEEKKEKYRILYDAGLIDAAIARELGESPASVSQWRRKEGLPSHFDRHARRASWNYKRGKRGRRKKKNDYL